MLASLISRRFASTAAAQRIVLVDGCRIPFKLSSTDYKSLIAQDLGRLAIKGLLTKTAIDPAALDFVLYGTVIQEVRTSNIARESALAAGIPDTVPSHTVTLACISSNVAITSGANMILSGQASAIIAGGAETMSDVPIRFGKKMRQKLMAASKYKGIADLPKFLKGLSLKDLMPEAPAIAEFSTGEVMGHSSDRLASRFGVTRKEQDEFALRSHHNAAKAHAAGLYKDEIVPVNGSVEENGVRGDSTMEKLSSLKPAFVKPHGTHTAANSSYLTDGASAVLIMSEAKALAMGFTPKVVLKDWNYVSQDPKEELLLGPAYAVNKLMHRNGLSVGDVGVWELHEAFAGQVLANMRALDSDAFAKDSCKLPKKLGEIPMDKLNVLGGSLAIGHPFGATGGRIITTSANRMLREGSRYGVLAACAAGGQATAMLLEAWTPLK